MGRQGKETNNQPISTIQVEKGPQLNNASKSLVLTYGEALDKIKFGKLNYFLIIVSGVVLANVLLETAQIGFILPISQCDLQLSTQQKGVLSAIGYAGIICSSHLWGFLADTKGRRAVIYPTLIITFFLTLVSSFVQTFWLLVTIRFFNGFFVSGGSATIYAYLGEFHTDKSRSRALMGSSFVFAIGAMILPMVAFVIINQDWRLFIPFLDLTFKPWRLFLIVCGIPGFLCGICMFFLPESPKFLLSIGKEEEAIEVLKTMHSVNNGGKGDFELISIIPDKDTPVRSEADEVGNPIKKFLSTMWRQTVPLFQRNHLRATLLVCTIQFWLYVTTNGMYMWFPDILNSMVEFVRKNPGNNTRICDIVYAKQAALYNDGMLQLDECNEKLEMPTYFYSLFMEVMYATGFAVIGVIINRVGKIPILFTVLVVFGSCGIASIYVNAPQVVIYLYVFLFLCGVGINVLGAATVELYPTHLRAMAICISLMVGRLGSVVGANTVGALLDGHCETAFLIASIALIASGFLAFLIPKPEKIEDENMQTIESPSCNS